MLGNPCDVTIELSPVDWLSDFEVITTKGQRTQAVYPDHTDVRGKVFLAPRKGPVDHAGIRAELIGHISVRGGALSFFQGTRRRNFLHVSKTLVEPGRLSNPEILEFHFDGVEAPYDSYAGSSVTVAYCVQVTLQRKRSADIASTKDIWVRRQRLDDSVDTALCPSLLAVTASAKGRSLWSRPYHTHPSAGFQAHRGRESIRLGQPARRGASAPARRPPSAAPVRSARLSLPSASAPQMQQLVECPMTLRVGTEGTSVELAARFEKNIYHTSDIIRGRVTFSAPRGSLPVSSAELSVERREFLSADGAGAVSDSAVLFTSEILDGDPDDGQDIPFSLPLRGVTTLTPTYTSLQQRASVLYFVRATLVLCDGREFSNEQEVFLWRTPDRATDAAAAARRHM
eukprot:TRINITY_DN1340_c2_g3_i2.p1 TRINITY_DN1340_c2_g3~~TRINITY_DN1340_c2_g3_i2.p1  ORF type:complete len:400 (+),score=88.77 TRINITY_DN1340_c2_g3_i2:73-1272(+)